MSIDASANRPLGSATRRPIAAVQAIREWFFARVIRLADDEALPLTFHRKRVYILPTGFGYYFGTLLLLMLIGGLNYNNSMILLLTFWFAAIGLVVMLHTYRNLVDLTVTAISSKPVFAGQLAAAQLTLHAESERRMLQVLADDHHDDIAYVGRQGAKAHVHVATNQRGWQALPRVRIESRYPLGLFRSWGWLQPAAKVLVYPKPEENAPNWQPPAAGSSGRKERRGEDELADIREYQPGDPPRLIAWKAVARTDRLMSKTFSAVDGEEIVFDFNALAAIDSVELRLSRLTAWLERARAERLAYGLILPNQQIATGRGAEHHAHCLRALALFPQVTD